MSAYLAPTGLILLGIGSALATGYLAFGSAVLRSEYFSDPGASRVLTVLSAFMAGVSVFFFVAAGKMIP